MHSVWHRLNSLLTYGSTVLLTVCILTSATGEDTSSGYLITIAVQIAALAYVLRFLAHKITANLPEWVIFFVDFLVHRSDPKVSVKPAKIEAVSRGPEGDWVRLQVQGQHRFPLIQSSCMYRATRNPTRF